MIPALATDDASLQAFADTVGAEGPVAVRGGGTRWDLGGPLDPDTQVLAAPSGIVDYQPAEMTVTVRAGTRVAELNQVLAERGQHCALPDRGGTVGGAVVVGENDLGQRGRGTVSSAMLQVRYVSAEGRVITGGGPTVKNVTGFDLPRLLCRSLGTLGLLAEVTLRTNPQPEVAHWLVGEGVDPFAVNDCLLRPGAILWDGDRTWVLVEGIGRDVEAETARLEELGSFDQVEGPPPLPPHRWSFPPRDLRALGGGAHQLTGGGGTSPKARPEGRFVASVGVGLVWADQEPPPRSLDPVAATIAARLKHNFDPTGRLNPGRSPGGW